MKVLRTLMTSALSLMVAAVMAGDYTVQDNFVTIPVKTPTDNGAKVVRLQVINDNIIRVQATSENALPSKPRSLMIVPQTAKPKFDVSESDTTVIVKAANVQAVVMKADGAVSFYDAEGKLLTKEAKNGKRRCRIFVSRHSRLLAAKARSLEGYVSLIGGDETDGGDARAIAEAVESVWLEMRGEA